MSTATAPAPGRIGAGTGPRAANEAWEAAMEAHATLMRRFAARPYWDGASMREYDVLYTLAKCGRPQRLSDIANHVLLSQGALSRLVDRLVARGLVARCTDPADARAVHLSLTDEGRTVQRRIGRAHARDVADALSHLTATELATLRHLSHRLISQELA